MEDTLVMSGVPFRLLLVLRSHSVVLFGTCIATVVVDFPGIPVMNVCDSILGLMSSDAILYVCAKSIVVDDC